MTLSVEGTIYQVLTAFPVKFGIVFSFTFSHATGVFTLNVVF